MSKIADFSKLTIDVLRLIERFTYLTKSNRFNLPNLINLIKLMNKYSAGNREIWIALEIGSELTVITALLSGHLAKVFLNVWGKVFPAHRPIDQSLFPQNR